MANRAAKRTYRQIFMDELTKLSKGEATLIGNITFRKHLNWDEDRYDRIKGQLSDEKSIIVGRGKGGSVGLAQVPGTKGLSAFVSYCHADESYKNELLSHLQPLQRLGLIESWHDRKIKAGTEWGTEISEHLEKASIILMMISVDFINSTYCYDIELERAMERHARQEARVIPIIVRNCLWQGSSFAKLQALPKDTKAISAWPDRDDAWVNVATEIRKVADDLLKAV